MLTPGDVVVVLFTYSDMSGAKVRPAIVVSSETYMLETGMLVLAAISSKAVRNHFELSVTEWRLAGLRLPSKVCAGKLMTVNMGLVKKIGHLSDADISRVRELTGEIINF